MPFKRYQIGEVFRDGPIKLGRYREFWQCDVDIVGIKQITAEAELLALTKDTEILKKRFQAFLDVIKGFPNGDRYYFIIKLLYSLEEMGLIEEHFSKVLETVSQIQFPTHNDDWYWIASLFIRIAEIHRDRNEFSSALRRVSDASKIYNKLGNNFRSLRDTATKPVGNKLFSSSFFTHRIHAYKSAALFRRFFRFYVCMYLC